MSACTLTSLPAKNFQGFNHFLCFGFHAHCLLPAERFQLRLQQEGYSSVQDLKCKPCLSLCATDLLLHSEFNRICRRSIRSRPGHSRILAVLHEPADSMCQPEQPSAEAHIVTVQYAELLKSEDLTAQIAEVTRINQSSFMNII